MDITDRTDEKIIVTINPELKSIVPDYLRNRGEDLKVLLKALSVNNFEAIQSIGHKLKGSGAGYGFSGLSEIGQHLETAAVQKDRDRIRKLIKKFRFYLENVEWSVAAPEPGNQFDLKLDINSFKKMVAKLKGIEGDELEVLMLSNPMDLYFASANVGIKGAEISRLIAEHLHLPYLPILNPDSMIPNFLPVPFCRQNLVVPVLNEAAETTFALSNPFNWELMDALKKYMQIDTSPPVAIAEPASIINLLNATMEKEEKGEKESGLAIQSQWTKKKEISDPSVIAAQIETEIEKRPVVYITNNIIDMAANTGASDIHIEPKETKTIVRFRIDGELQTMFNLRHATGTMLISRFKAIGGIDIAEKMKPQDGTIAVKVGPRPFKLRLATTSTAYGESLIIRMLDPTVEPADLRDLGMTDQQAETLIGMATRGRGCILIVGTTGSGKTTTIYSLLSKIDCRKKSLITVEDPVEYQIADANQQQINEKAGVTFQALLKSSVRQDPDILFIGEIRDSFSANTALDFSSTGHLTISTLHTSNVTTAIFRLERLGVSRLVMAEAVRAIAAQRLLKKLCADCRRIGPISPEERELLAPYTDKIPEQVAHPVGCPKCGNRGYKGRKGLFEIMVFDMKISQMIREEKPISEIRQFMWDRGDYLISQHALDNVRNFNLTPRDIYDTILVEEGRFMDTSGPKKVAPATVEESRKEGRSILVVEDDQDIRRLVSLALEREGYAVTAVADGVEALFQLGKKSFDLIISDVNMPNLDGFRLMEILGQKGFSTPLIFLTSYGDPENEIRGLELGATDYIKKPFQENLLLLRVKKIL